MIAPFAIATLLHDLFARGDHVAVIEAADGLPAKHASRALAADATALARGLIAEGHGGGSHVALWAPNGRDWIAVALGVMAAGAVLVPVDDLADAALFGMLMRASGARLAFVATEHLPAARACVGEGATLLAMEEGGWHALSRQESTELPAPSPDAPAALFMTSGTTAAPKLFHLSHRNIGVNIAALVATKLVNSTDRALLPLPLYHAYPLIVGMLSTLACGTAIILPQAATGPAIMQALRDGDATAIIGVPRLYEAMLAALHARVAGSPWLIRPVLRGVLNGAVALQRRGGPNLGPFVLAPLRRQLGRHLRLLVSGGARLDPATEDELRALGFDVHSGYGLAETASMFTGNVPTAWRRGSAGKPVADGEIRIEAPDTSGIGEVILRGPSVTSGYLGDPALNDAAFTTDGWFRTGDLGEVDPDGFLFITGRAKEILVLGGGKKVDPEELERVYGESDVIAEIAVLEHEGALVGLVVPDVPTLRAGGVTNLRDGVRVALAMVSRGLPPYQHLAGFALTEAPLPRTRLGKYRRFLLPELYRQAVAGGGARRAASTPPDPALLADPQARAAWEFLRQRFGAEQIGPEVSFGLDLHLDSFGWMELALALQERLGVSLTEADTAGIETVADLLRRAPGWGKAEGGALPPIAEDIDHWLAPTGPLLTAAGVALYWINRWVMRGLFRLRVSGVEHLPVRGACVLAPNHLSDLDAMAIAAALPLAQARRLYWAGDIVRLFYNAASRTLCRAIHLFPVDERHPGAAVGGAVRVLAAGHMQVWFSEAWRSPDGRLQRFLPGVGQVLLRSGAPAVPTWIGGAYEALPRGKRIPRFVRLSVDFGPPTDAQVLRAEGDGGSDEERVAHALRRRLVDLATSRGHAVVDALY